MKNRFFIVFFIFLGMIFSGCINNGDNNEKSYVELIYMSGCGTMPSSLANGQIDAYIAWQPLVSVAEVSNIGKVVTYSQEMPPEGKWVNHPCCCLVATNDFTSENYDVAKYLTILMIFADEYIQTHNSETVDYCAEWLFGGQQLTFGDIVVESSEVEQYSIQTIKFVTEPTQDWLDGIVLFVESLKEIEMVTDELVGLEGQELLDKILYMDLYNDARAEIDDNTYLENVVQEGIPNVKFGYLPSDHDAALFVAAYEWEYFRDEYGIYLFSNNPGEDNDYQLFVNNTLVANVNVIEFAAGSAAMTAASQGNLDYAIVGAPPAILFIDKGAPMKIISPVQTEGSAVVVPMDAPVQDWNEFISWIKDNYENNNTIKIGVPMIGSIQDVMLKYALQESGIEFQ